MYRRIEGARIILRMLYESLFTILIISFLSLFFLKVQLDFVVMGIVLLLFCCSYFVRNIAPNNIVVFGIHCVFCAGCFYLPFSIGARILVACVILFLLRDALLYVARGTQVTPLTGAPWPTFLLSFAIYLFSLYSDETVFHTMAYLIPVVLVVLYYLMTYVEGLYNYYLFTKDTKEQLMKGLVITNTGIIGLLLLVFFVVVCVGNLHLIQSMLESLLQGLVFCLRLVVLAVLYLLKKVLFSFRFSEEQVVFDEGDIIKRPEDTTEPTGVWLLYLVLGMGMLFLLYILIRNFIRLLLVKRRAVMNTVNENHTVITKIEKQKPKRRKRRRAAINDKGRRYYRRRILKLKRFIKMNDKCSCWDIAGMIAKEQLDDVNELTEYYSVIRYGSEEEDNQELVAAMKRLSERGVRQNR